jgi:hypothetical protein
MAVACVVMIVLLGVPMFAEQAAIVLFFLIPSYSHTLIPIGAAPLFVKPAGLDVAQ